MSRRTFSPLTTSVLIGLAIIGCSTQSPFTPSVASVPAGTGPIIDISRPTQESQPQYIARLHTELATGYYTRKQYQIALEEVAEALKADARYAPAYGMMALIHSNLGDFTGAENAFIKATQVAPNDPDIRNNYGAFLCERRRFKEAVTQFEYSLRNPLYQTPHIALRNAAECATKGGDRERASRFYQQLGQPMPAEEVRPQPAPVPPTATPAATSTPTPAPVAVPLAPLAPATPTATTPVTPPSYTFQPTAPTARQVAPTASAALRPAQQPTPASPSATASQAAQSALRTAHIAYEQGDLLGAQDAIKRALQAPQPTPAMLHLALCIERRFANSIEEDRYADLLIKQHAQSSEARSLNTSNRGCS